MTLTMRTPLARQVRSGDGPDVPSGALDDVQGALDGLVTHVLVGQCAAGKGVIVSVAAAVRAQRARTRQRLRRRVPVPARPDRTKTTRSWSRARRRRCARRRRESRHRRRAAGWAPAKGQFVTNNVATSNAAIRKLAPELLAYFASGVRTSMFDLGLLHLAARCKRIFVRGTASPQFVQYVRRLVRMPWLFTAAWDAAKRTSRGRALRGPTGRRF
jgi:hypothetical protein